MLERIESVYREIAAAIATHQQLIIVAYDQRLKRQLAAEFPAHANVRIVIQPTNDTWIRDFGPLGVDVNTHTQLIDFRFDAWGGKYDARLDDSVSQELALQGMFDCAIQHDSLVLEGGAVETDGQGTLLATRDSIICERRNPGLEQAQIEQHLAEVLGVDRFHWFDCSGLQGDDTDGHIDTLVRFANPETLLYATCSPDHPDREALEKLEKQVQVLRQRNGAPYRTIALPCPGVHRDANGRIVPASYANFLIVNERILQPVYGSKNDAAVVEIMRRAFPGREIIPIDSRTLIEQNGSIHCATMQTACPLQGRSRTIRR